MWGCRETGMGGPAARLQQHPGPLESSPLSAVVLDSIFLMCPIFGFSPQVPARSVPRCRAFCSMVGRFVYAKLALPTSRHPEPQHPQRPTRPVGRLSVGPWLVATLSKAFSLRNGFTNRKLCFHNKGITTVDLSPLQGKPPSDQRSALPLPRPGAVGTEALHALSARRQTAACNHATFPPGQPCRCRNPFLKWRP